MFFKAYTLLICLNTKSQLFTLFVILENEDFFIIIIIF